MKPKPFSTEVDHNPLHNIVVPYKPRKPELAIINCLCCGKMVRLGTVGESPLKEMDRTGGVDAKRWFCCRGCLLLYSKIKGQKVKNPMNHALAQHLRGYTGRPRNLLEEML